MVFKLTFLPNYCWYQFSFQTFPPQNKFGIQSSIKQSIIEQKLEGWTLSQVSNKSQETLTFEKIIFLFISLGRQ